MYRVYRRIVTHHPNARLKPCIRAFQMHLIPQLEDASPVVLPALSFPRSHFATRGGGRGPPPAAARDDDDDIEDDDDVDAEFEQSDDDTGYEVDYDTWNLLHQGKKPNEKSRRWPLPMYKAREMVDFRMINNRLDGLKVITDPNMEYEYRKQLHEGLVDFYKRTQAAFDEIDAAQKREEEKAKKKEEEKAKKLDSGEAKQKLEGGEGENPQLEDGINQVSSNDVKSSEQTLEKQDASAEEEDSSATAETKDESIAEEGKEDAVELLSEMTSAIDDVIKDVITVPELNETDQNSLEVQMVKQSDEDEVNVFNYDKWVAYRDEEMRKRYEIKKNQATLRWKIQLVLGPGDVWHPANRKASVSVYVRELGLSKYAKQRLLALVGKRYKSPKDELTITSERYQHRYENQKDVLRTLLALIEEARKADQFVNDARIKYLKEQNMASKAISKGIQAQQIAA